ncbi:MAG: hypothetical protein M1133_15755, partial [Armatimonadetes bacterium]|nr:hypothetical protein [Armatimonadota bacterium]
HTIKSVSIRKGPMGAVIHVCADDNQESVSQSGAKGNIIMFTSPDGIGRCDALASKIEEVIGKPVDRVEHKPENTAAVPAPPEPVDEQSPEAVAEVVDSAAGAPETTPEEPKKPKARGGRVAKSLAEEMFDEIDQPEPAALEPKVEPDSPVQEPVAIEVPPAKEPVATMARDPLGYVDEELAEEHSTGFRPNPNLPKPVKKKQSAPTRVLVLLGALAALALVGIAVTAPLRQPVTGPSIEINVSQLTGNVKLLRGHYTAVSKYRKQVTAILDNSNRTAAQVANAVRSGNRQAVIAALNKDNSVNAWRKLSELKVPSGLAGAKESLVSGLFIRKSAVGNASGLGVSSASETLRRFADADALIKRGNDAIDRMLAELESKMKTRPAKGAK